jgi:fatty acid desaturase
MSADEVLGQLRRFLLVLSALLFCGAITELWLVGHTEDKIQWLAFALAGLGAIAALVMLIFPGRATLHFLRICMAVVVLGSLFGIYEHVTGNIAFEREMHPDMPSGQAVWKGLQGANPLLAPGILAIAALLALSATYRNEITSSK